MIKHSMRPSQGRSVIAALGGLLALVGIRSPWIVIDTVGGACAHQRGSASLVGSIIVALALMVLVAGLLHQSIRRMGVAVFSLAGWFWGMVWLLWYDTRRLSMLAEHNAAQVQLGIGWYLTVLGFVLAFLASLITPLWRLGNRHDGAYHAR